MPQSEHLESHLSSRCILQLPFAASLYYQSTARCVAADGRAESIWQQLGYPCSAFLSTADRPNQPARQPQRSRVSSSSPRRSRSPVTHHASATLVPPRVVHQGHYDTAYNTPHALTYEQSTEQDGYMIQSADALTNADLRLQLEVAKLTSRKKQLENTSTVSPSTLITAGAKRPRARSAGAESCNAQTAVPSCFPAHHVMPGTRSLVWIKATEPAVCA